MSNPTLALRRDFADELGFGVFLQANQIVSAGAARENFNRNVGLSPDMPRFVGYYTHNGQGCITVDGERIYQTPLPGLFEEMTKQVEAAAASDPLWAGAASAGGYNLTLEADRNGSPVLVLIHDVHTCHAYLMDIKNARGILRDQPEINY
jgi:hypothetical protein